MGTIDGIEEGGRSAIGGEDEEIGVDRTLCGGEQRAVDGKEIGGDEVSGDDLRCRTRSWDVEDLERCGSVGSGDERSATGPRGEGVDVAFVGAGGTGQKGNG